MSIGPWKKYKKKKIKNVNGKKGYIFEKKIYIDKNGQGHLFLPSRLSNKEVVVVIFEKEQAEEIKQKMLRKPKTFNPFK